MRRDYFAWENRGELNFENHYYKPFLKRYIEEIRSVDPEALIFMEGVLLGVPPQWEQHDPSHVVNASHWYDSFTLLTKIYNPEMTVNLMTRQMVFGAADVQKLFTDQLAA